MSRDDFTRGTLDTIAKRVGFKCSNPDCRQLTAGPRLETSKTVNIGVGAHISAASKGGPRFNANLTPEQRQASENGIWLCQNCAKLIDNDSSRFTIDVLLGWKATAEDLAHAEISKTPLESTSKATIRIEIVYRRIKILSERHDYLLEVKVSNLGMMPIKDFHADLRMPLNVINNPSGVPSFVEDKSTKKVGLFRVASQDGKPIYPKDTVTIISVPYFMDSDLYGQREQLFTETVEAEFYDHRGESVRMECHFCDLQIF